ncbi:hypothetical protein [Nocardia inohanensis]|uniref:hypothetical protein n=1 Tax=Nocardia inohanensis TaxID=209246 RepID=UPI0008339598|nr:hypothetical protein [Nocardia inohanensis]
MTTTIVSAAVCTDVDSNSYFELAARAGRAALEQAGVSPDHIGLIINAGVFRDSNISEPAVAALIQKRLEVGLEYRTGRLPAFSFDLLNGGNGVVHSLMAAQTFIAAGDLEYALVVAGDTHPSLEREVEGFPYTPTGAALLLRLSGDAGGFGRLYTAQESGAIAPTGWADLVGAGTNGRAAMTIGPGSGDPLEAAAEAVTQLLAGEGLELNDFATGAAVLLTPAPIPGFRERLAYRLGVPSSAVAGVDPAVGDPYSAAPVHAYLTAAQRGLLDAARAVVFLGVDDSSAACLVYRPHALASTGPASDG